jgi:hypothetical protein
MPDLRKLARGKACQVRIPQHCNHNRSTTVLAHYRLAGYSGIGTKPDNYAWGAWCCSACHDVVDGRVKTDHDRTAVRLMHAEGCLRTQHALMEMKRNGEL